MKLSTKGFNGTIERLGELRDEFQTQKFQDVLLAAVQPIADSARSNVNSVTGRTRAAIIAAPGKNPQFPSAYVKIDRKIAMGKWRGTPYFYPGAVERGHGGKHAAPAHPFFAPAVANNQSQVLRSVEAGIETILKPYQTTMTIGGEFD